MAAFIVISADNRLHYLVDGIIKCCPPNPNVQTNISTGKISRKEDGYTYEYCIPVNSVCDKSAKSLSYLLSNQLAAFRLAYDIPENRLVNIFFLENPLSENDYAQSQSWIDEFKKVYNSDKSFCLFRVIFSYNHDTPTDIKKQINVDVLKSIIGDYRGVKDDESETFPQYVFYVDNQKSDSAALCLNKEEHNLKIPRYLIDFMMLVSNDNDSYNVINAISGTTRNIRFFAVGFGESMYYYPDVENYFVHADSRDLNLRYLTVDDETGDDVLKGSMDIEKKPFGLRKRMDKLSKLYENVPFDEDVLSYPKSADKEINDCLTLLKTYVEAKRQEEINNVETRKKEIEILKDKINNLQIGGEESSEDFEKLLTEYKAELETKENELQKITVDCPEFIDRQKIYEDLCVVNPEDKESFYTSCEARYNHLLSFVLTKEFLDYVRLTPVMSDKTNQPSNSSHLKENPGCLASLMFWKHTTNEEGPTINDIKKVEPLTPSKAITTIKEQRDLKMKFSEFKSEVSLIEDRYEEERKYCDDFKLTEHTNHYCPLIILNELKKTHNTSSDKRLSETISSWHEQQHPTKASLDQKVKEKSHSFTSHKYSYIDWDKPFDFILRLSADEDLPLICNELQKKSAPFVNYNLTSELKDNKIVRYIYSDRPDFNNEFNLMKGKIYNGNEISVFTSTHIASKICFMQFLPMDDDVLNNLVDLQESETDIDEILDSETISDNIGDGVTCKKDDNNDDNSAPHVLDWGEY